MTWVKSRKAVYVGYALPIVEILIGLLFFRGLRTCESAAGGLLMLASSSASASASGSARRERGPALDCSCFGGGETMAASQTQSAKDILRDVGVAACAAWVVVGPRSPFSLDHRLFG